MAKRSSALAFCLLLGSIAFGGCCACSYATGVPIKKRWNDFLENTVRPLREYGPSPKLPPPDDLKDWPRRSPKSMPIQDRWDQPQADLRPDAYMGNY